MYHNIIAIIKLSRATHCHLLRYHLFIISQKQQPNRKETWRLTGHMRNRNMKSSVFLLYSPKIHIYPICLIVKIMHRKYPITWF